MNKFDEVLKKNREVIKQHRSRALEMQRKRIKKEQRKKNITAIFVATYILISTYINIWLLFS